jgi:hypothetical protein
MLVMVTPDSGRVSGRRTGASGIADGLTRKKHQGLFFGFLNFENGAFQRVIFDSYLILRTIKIM